MANRIIGTYDFSANFEVKLVGPLDARSKVDSLSNLTDELMDNSYPYLGMVVSVVNDTIPINNGLYLLSTLPNTDILNWSKVGTGAESFMQLDETNFTTSNFSTEFLNAPNESVQVKSFSFTDVVAKDSTIVIKINSSLGQHFLLKLPSFSELNSAKFAGKRIKILMKSNGILNKRKNFMICTAWEDNGSVNQLLSTSVNTKYNNIGYFLPLETIESVNLLWDGDDWLAMDVNKQQYTMLSNENFTTDSSEYINRP